MFFFFFNDTATTEIYTYGHTLSLHDALPVATAVAPASCQRRALAASQALGRSSGMSVSCRVTNWAWGDSVMAGSVYSVGRGYAPDASHAWVKYQVGCGWHGRPGCRGCRGCRGRSPDLRDASIGVAS